MERNKIIFAQHVDGLTETYFIALAYNCHNSLHINVQAKVLPTLVTAFHEDGGYLLV